MSLNSEIKKKLKLEFLLDYKKKKIRRQENNVIPHMNKKNVIFISYFNATEELMNMN